jgi:hypothetical protein
MNLGKFLPGSGIVRTGVVFLILGAVVFFSSKLLNRLTGSVNHIV